MGVGIFLEDTVRWGCDIPLDGCSVDSEFLIIGGDTATFASAAGSQGGRRIGAVGCDDAGRGRERRALQEVETRSWRLELRTIGLGGVTAEAGHVGTVTFELGLAEDTQQCRKKHQTYDGQLHFSDWCSELDANVSTAGRSYRLWLLAVLYQLFFISVNFKPAGRFFHRLQLAVLSTNSLRELKRNMWLSFDQKFVELNGRRTKDNYLVKCRRQLLPFEGFS